MQAAKWRKMQAFSLSVDSSDERSSCQQIPVSKVEAAIGCHDGLGASFELFCDFFLLLGLGLRFLKKAKTGWNFRSARCDSAPAARRLLQPLLPSPPLEELRSSAWSLVNPERAKCAKSDNPATAQAACRPIFAIYTPYTNAVT